MAQVAAAAGAVDGDATAVDAGCDMIVAPVELKLKAAIALKRRTEHPILLVDQLGRLAGLCDDDAIYRGLLHRGGVA